tara:strand:- start:1467 stop:1679 length:213 start_codon:yes stop_codon:yes gene_type:complete
VAGLAACSASAIEAKTLHASAAAATRPTHTLYRALRRERFLVSVSGVCSAFYFCAPTAPAVGDGGVESGI